MKNIGIILGSLFIFVGCDHLDGDNLPPGGVPPQKIQKDIQEEVKIIGEETNKIYDGATDSRQKIGEALTIARSGTTPERIDQILGDLDKLLVQVDENQENIIQSTIKIVQSTSDLTKINIELEKINTYLDEVDKSNKALKKDNDELRKDNEAKVQEIKEFEEGVKAANNKIWMGIVGLCALGAAIGVALAIWVSPKVGIGITVGSLMLSSIAYFMAQYAMIVAIVGGCVFLGGVIWALYTFIVHKKALVESAISMEALKHKDWDEVKESIKDLQSNTTASLIRDIKYKERIGN